MLHNSNPGYRTAADRSPLRRRDAETDRRPFVVSRASSRRPFDILVLLALTALIGCNSNRVMTPDEPPGASADTIASAKTASDSSRLDSTTASNGPTVMPSGDSSATATTHEDSVRTSVADEYEPLDDTTQGFAARPQIETGPKPAIGTVRRTPEGFSDTTNPVASFKGLTSAELTSAGLSPKRATPSPRTASTATAPATSPVEGFKGLSRQELLSVPGYRPSASTQATTRPSGTRETSPAPQRRAMPQPERSTRHNSLGSPERTYIDGLAAERAGNYQEAVEKLGHTLTTLKSNAQRTEARYYYARSLEGLGRLDEAAEQYRRVSQSNDSLSHAALIDYCRTLGRLGENERARTLVLQFLRRHPGSSQVPEAQRLLQTL